MIRYHDIKVTPEEIEAVKKEYFETHTYHGTDKPVVLDDKTAVYVLRGRKYHEAYLNSPHKSHKLTRWETRVLAPAGTPRFYNYRECKVCGRAQYYCAAGRFNELEKRCKN